MITMIDVCVRCKCKHFKYTSSKDWQPVYCWCTVLKRDFSSLDTIESMVNDKKCLRLCKHKNMFKKIYKVSKL